MNSNEWNAKADAFDLARFIEAQESVYAQALAELRRGRKTSHWMWFIFPQIEGLGHSAMAQRYAIKDLNEARAYLNHPLLGKRLIESCEALLQHSDLSASAIFGFPDDMKLKSSLTLFSLAADENSVFTRVLDQYFEGEPDQNTLDLV